jgi:hypothetical protein
MELLKDSASRRSRRTRGNSLPDKAYYSDTGCDVYPSCLNCPLPRCRYEDPGGAAAILRQERDGTILKLWEGGALGIDALAQTFGLSRRTIFRVLRTHQGDGFPSPDEFEAFRPGVQEEMRRYA